MGKNKKSDEILWKCISFDKISKNLIQSELCIDAIKESLEEFKDEIQIIIFALSKDGIECFDTNKNGQFEDFLRKIKTNEICKG